MANTGNWTILGDERLAAMLTEAAKYIDAPSPMTVSTSPDDYPGGAVATGAALLADGARSVVSPLYGFRVLEEAARAVQAGEAGKIYGVFGSYRLERGASSDELRDQALVPLLAYTLEIFQSAVERVMVRQASLLASDDAWFVTIRLADETLLTLEVMATRSSGAGPQVLVEITGSEQVLRVEPTRQSVILERTDAPAQALPWWEDEAERLLAYIASRSPEIRSGERLREVWAAAEQSLESSTASTL
jgi:predicted dehydrogenase